MYQEPALHEIADWQSSSDYQYSMHLISKATGIEESEVYDLALTPWQAGAIGTGLWENKLLNPPKNRPAKTRIFHCEKCGRQFFEVYKTSHFRYCPTCRRGGK